MMDIDFTQETVYLEYFGKVTDLIIEKGVEMDRLARIIDTDRVHEIAFDYLKDKMDAKKASDAILNFVEQNKY